MAYANSGAEPRSSDIFPTEDAIARLIGAILLEHYDRWAVQRARHMSGETVAPLSDVQSSACTPPQPDTPGQARRRTRTPLPSYTNA